MVSSAAFRAFSCEAFDNGRQDLIFWPFQQSFDIEQGIQEVTQAFEEFAHRAQE